MGIPSYFKRLTDTVRGLLSPSIQSKVSCLLVDFNCIVYGCLRSDALLPYTTEESGVWEHSLNEEVCKSLVKLWEAAGLSYSNLLSKLVETAEERFNLRNELRRVR